MEREDRRRLFRKPMMWLGAGSVCSAIARAVGIIWVAVPLLAVALGCLVAGGVNLVQVVNSLPPEQRQKERRSMVIGAVGSIAAVAVLTGLIVLFMD